MYKTCTSLRHVFACGRYVFFDEYRGLLIDGNKQYSATDRQSVMSPAIFDRVPPVAIAFFGRYFTSSTCTPLSLTYCGLSDAMDNCKIRTTET